MARTKEDKRKNAFTDRNVLPVEDFPRENGHTTDTRAPEVVYASNLEFERLMPADFDPHVLRKVYRTMLLTRRLDEKMMTLLKQGKGYFHAGCSGHEAAQAAVALYARPGHDWFCTYYRDLCMVLSLGMTARETMLAHLAKADDPNSGGRQMSQHFGKRELNVMSPSSSVGAQFLPALGFGMAVQRWGHDAFVCASGGEGATSQGDFHEALNWASRIHAPVLFLIQDNKFAISVPVEEQTAGGTPYKLTAGYEGLMRVRVDGTDFFRTASAARAAIEHIRAGRGPVCLVADVVRLLPHSSSDNHSKYRSDEELSKARKIDPLVRMELRLLEEGILDQRTIDVLRTEVNEEVDEAARWAAEQSDPRPEDATRYVLFEGSPDVEIEASEPSGKPQVMVDAVNSALREEMARDERILVYGEDVAGSKGGVFMATRNLTKLFGKNRCFNSPLAEGVRDRHGRRAGGIRVSSPWWRSSSPITSGRPCSSSATRSPPSCATGRTTCGIAPW